VKPTLHKLRSICALGIVSLFAIFLAASQPHRVHHLLENLPAAGHGDRNDADISDRQPSAPRAIDEKLPAEHDSRPADRQWKPHHGAGPHHHSDHAQTSRQGHTHEDPTRDAEPSTSGDDNLRSHAHEDQASPLHAQNGPTDEHHDGQPKTDCATQGVAKHAHLSPIPAAEIALVFSFFARLADCRTALSGFLVYLPFSPRAPPQSELLFA